MAAAAVADPAPYPPSITESPSPVSVHKLPFFGHKSGNYQPNTHSSNATKTHKPGKRETGEWVQIPADARWDNTNIQDGIGNGWDGYTMHWGSGGSWDGWPTRNNWVSFQNM